MFLSWHFLEKNLSQCLLFTTNPTQIGPVLNPIFSVLMSAIKNPGNCAILSLNLV